MAENKVVREGKELYEFVLAIPIPPAERKFLSLSLEPSSSEDSLGRSTSLTRSSRSSCDISNAAVSSAVVF